MSEKIQNITINKRTLEILVRIGCPEKEIINTIICGARAKTDDSLINDLLNELIIQQPQEDYTSQTEPETTLISRGGNHNPTGQNQYSDIETDNKKEVYEHILNNVGLKRKDLILITKNFSCKDYEVFSPYITEMPKSVIVSVENWIKKIKLNESVTIEFIIKQFFNFAQRNNVSIFKEKKNDGQDTIS